MKIVLQAYKLRGQKFIPLTEEFLEVGWEGYKQLLSESNSKNSLLILRKARAGVYIGLREDKDGRASTFIYFPEGSPESARGLVLKNPTIEHSLKAIYRIIKVDFGCFVKT